ncbi:MAG: hypothetical protein ACOVRP_15465, partial [Gemmatimonas sp.]
MSSSPGAGIGAVSMMAYSGILVAPSAIGFVAEHVGFRLTYGEDDTGFQMMYLRRGGGYYFNVGCSDMIVDGRIRLLQYDDIERFETGGVRLKDGTLREAELVVVATGYENQQETVRAFLGDAV